MVSQLCDLRLEFRKYIISLDSISGSLGPTASNPGRATVTLGNPLRLDENRL